MLSQRVGVAVPQMLRGFVQIGHRSGQINQGLVKIRERRCGLRVERRFLVGFHSFSHCLYDLNFLANDIPIIVPDIYCQYCQQVMQKPSDRAVVSRPQSNYFAKYGWKSLGAGEKEAAVWLSGLIRRAGA